MIVRLNHTPKDHTHIFQMTKFWSKIVFLSNFNLPKTLMLLCNVFCVFYYIANFWNLSFFKIWNLAEQSSYLVGSDNFLVLMCWGWFHHNFWRWFSLYFIFFEMFLSFPWWHWYLRVDSYMNGISSNGMCIRSLFHPFSEHNCGNFDSFNK